MFRRPLPPPNGKKIAADKAGVAVTDRGHGNILGGMGGMIGEIALAIVGRCAPSPSSRTVSTSGTYSTPSGRTQNPPHIAPLREPPLWDECGAQAPRVTIVVASLEPRTRGAAMKDICGTLRTIIQRPGSRSAVAA